MEFSSLQKCDELSYVAKVSGKIYLTALTFYDTFQTIEQSFVVALVTFSLLPDLSRNNRNIYSISFLLQLTCLVSSSSSSVKIEHNINLIGWRTARTQQQIIEASAALRLIYSSLILF